MGEIENTKHGFPKNHGIQNFKDTNQSSSSNLLKRLKRMGIDFPASNSLTDRFLRALKEDCQSLRLNYLSLKGSQITESGINIISSIKCLPQNLEEFDLSFNHEINNNCCKILVSKFSRLNVLRVQGCSSVDSDQLNGLKEGLTVYGN